MTNRPNLALRWILVGVASLAGCEGISKLDATRLGRGSWQHPEAVVSALNLEPGNQVADIGAGKGYFVPYFAAAVGPEGLVYAVEVDDDRVESLRDRFSKERPNVHVIRGEFNDPLLPEGRIDTIVIVNTFHHIENRTDYFVRLQSNLAPAGRIAIIEPDSDLTGILSLFQHEGHTSAGPEIIKEMQAAGYQLVESHDFLPTQTFQIYAPAGNVGS